MNPEIDIDNIGEQMGRDGISNLVSHCETYCACTMQELDLNNEPKIVALQAEATFLLTEKGTIESELRLAPPPGGLRSRRRRAYYCWAIAIILISSAFAFSLYSFEPFRIGAKSYLYCLAVAIVTPFLLEKWMQQTRHESFLKGLVTMGAISALLSLVLLAVIRGNLLVEKVKADAPVVVLDGAQPEVPHADEPTSFYEKNLPLRRLVMALLAIAMELGAGQALFEAWRLGLESSENWEQKRARLQEIDNRLTLVASAMKTLQNEPAAFAARFWKHFYRALLTQATRNAITKGLMTLVILLILPFHVLAQGHTALVIAVDLTKSVAVKAPDGQSQFQKNMKAVTDRLTSLPADCRVTVIGITDRSFTEPDILLDAAIPADAGYFGERLAAARRQIVQAWVARTQKLISNYSHTDVIGAFALAAAIFNRDPSNVKKVLILYSDMRQSTADLNLESLRIVPKFKHMSHVEVFGLPQVHVSVLGADGAGKSIAYWESLHDFWTGYLHAAGAQPETYSVLR